MLLSILIEQSFIQALLQLREGALACSLRGGETCSWIIPALKVGLFSEGCLYYLALSKSKERNDCLLCRAGSALQRKTVLVVQQAISSDQAGTLRVCKPSKQPPSSDFSSP